MDAPATLRSVKALAAAGLIAPEALPALEQVAAKYAIAITPAMADLIETPDDAIGLQFLPQPAELQPMPQESADPVGDDLFSPVPGIVHRYPDRALLKITHTCAVYCRFCFRREMVGPEGLKPLDGAALDAALAYLANHNQIWEVIVTGGDPFILSPRRIADLMAKLALIDHVKVVRFHTRVPVVDPDRITADLVAALRTTDKAVYVALHANHIRELTPAARGACARLIDSGVPMLSQTVLLKGINDTPDSLGALMRGFVETRIKPYYLHHPDHAPGTGHFRSTIVEGQNIIRALRGRYSGLCLPTYILDIPDGHGKVPIGPNYLLDDEVADPRGTRHPYPPKP
ncbi:MAG: lysine 2,3-aminomutase [Phenylobacterium zucineum]|nr:MAG: lysine 2,3-aminomutase [Phenylobacterium zucineum]